MENQQRHLAFADWMAFVLESDLDTSSMMVCYVLRHHFGPGGTGAWPSVERLAKLAKLSVRKVRSALKAAEAAGLIRRQKRVGSDGRQTSNLYVPLRPSEIDGDRYTSTRGASGASLEGDRGVHHMQGEGAPHAPRTSPVRTKSKTPYSPPAWSEHPSTDAAIAFEVWWQEYPLKKGKQKALEIWQKKKLAERTVELVQKLREQKTRDRQFLAGYVPHATTYLNQARWEDEIEEVQSGKRRNGSSAVDRANDAEQRYARRFGGNSPLGDDGEDVRRPLDGQLRRSH